MVREVRRRQGWSQRELAQRCGVHARTIAAVESSARPPTLAVLLSVLDAAGLELGVDGPPPEVGPEVRRHLGRSLTWRLRRALGEDRRPLSHAGPMWSQLRGLAACGRLVLHTDAAIALWLPRATPLTQVEACHTATQPRPRPSTPDVDLVDDCALHSSALVAVSLASWTLGVDAPADLALDPQLAVHRPALRAVARLLHEQAPVDRAGRRVRAHADPDHVMEAAYVFHTKRFGNRPMPDAADRRGWRLGDDASLAAWLQRYGYPV